MLIILKHIEKMAFINLRSDKILYDAKGYFSVQSSFVNSYQGQQELALVFKVSETTYSMNYFGLGDGITYTIEQIENTSSGPWHWEINWYIPLVS